MRKDRHVRIRITEQQLKQLTSQLVKENKKKSQLIRDALNNYLTEKENL